MIKLLGPRMGVVSVKELGTNCWLPRRFVTDGTRCSHIWTCSYPEKKICQAIHVEIAYFAQEQARLARVICNLDIRIKELAKMLEK